MRRGLKNTTAFYFYLPFFFFRAMSGEARDKIRAAMLT
jgi:hypothetical protein